MTGVVTLTAVVPFRNPVAEATMFVLPGATGVTGTVTDEEFCATTTLGGREITVLSYPEKVTDTPPAPAGAPMVTVKFCGARDRLRGFGLSVIAVAPAVIVTVDGALFKIPSLTINCTTYVPARSATKLGDTVLAPCRAAWLPCGRAVNDQEYVSGFLLRAYEPEPFRVTVALTATFWFAPATATGGVAEVEIETVDGALLRNPSLTISWATY
jgi:hypothetical protein